MEKGHNIFHTWNGKSLYRAGSLSTVARELLRYKSDLVGVGEVRWDERGTLRAGDYIFFCGGDENNQLGAALFVHHGIVSAVTRVEFVSDRMSYIVLRGRWCNIVVLNVHAPNEEKNCD